MVPNRAGLVIAVAALVAACTTAPGATSGPATGAAATDPPMSVLPGTAAPASLLLEVATDPELGAFVAGEDGRSLYIFTPDAASPGTSTCNGQCAANWPPLTVAAAGEAGGGSGVSGAIGTVTRDDGTLQVTLGGNPLYYFAGDTAAGDVNGQGLNDAWYLASPRGTGIGAPVDEGPRY